MVSNPDWSELSHSEKMELFRDLNDEEIIQEYLPYGMTDSQFRKQLQQDRYFWNPNNIENLSKKGGPPTKDTVIGAFRDLSRGEAILELIDNSIDAWMRRKKKYPSQTAPELMIFIDVNEQSGILTYEDNAGGVGEDKLINLIIPGHSETIDTDKTIGSYRTGGKKAIFKLAKDANIRTRFWNPVGTTDEAYEIHLDEKWLTDPHEYQFDYGELRDKSILQKGQTIYILRMHESSRNWDVDVIDQVTKDIRRNYSLLMVRNPKIQIYFMDRSNPLEPFEDMYKFSGAYDEKSGLDIRPQRIRFKTKLDLIGQKHGVTLEVVLGCRTNSGAPKGEDGYGIDIYGNNRLFSNREYDLFRDWYDLPSGASRGFIRGYINVIGPNVLIPWDTHKRHLNTEREVIDVLKKHPSIKQMFKHWRSAYLSIAGLPEIKKIISEPLTPWKKRNNINVAHTADINIDATRRRKVRLPDDTFSPYIPPSEPEEKSREIKLAFSESEFKGLCRAYDIDPQESDAIKQLRDVVKESLLSEITD